MDLWNHIKQTAHIYCFCHVYACVYNLFGISPQVFSYEEAGDDDEDTFMMDAPCIREIIDLSGLKRNKVKKIGSGCGRVRREPGAADKAKKALFSKATTTPLIRLERLTLLTLSMTTS